MNSTPIKVGDAIQTPSGKTGKAYKTTPSYIWARMATGNYAGRIQKFKRGTLKKL